MTPSPGSSWPPCCIATPRQQGYDVTVGENTNILSYTDVADLS